MVSSITPGCDFAAVAQFGPVEFSLQCDFCGAALWIANNDLTHWSNRKGADDPNQWPGAEQLPAVELAQVRRLMRVKMQVHPVLSCIVESRFCSVFGQGPG